MVRVRGREERPRGREQVRSEAVQDGGRGCPSPGRTY